MADTQEPMQLDLDELLDQAEAEAIAWCRTRRLDGRPAPTVEQHLKALFACFERLGIPPTPEHQDYFGVRWTTPGAIHRVRVTEARHQLAGGVTPTPAVCRHRCEDPRARP